MKIINKIVTSKESILKTCKELVEERGLQSVSIRSLAKKCNVSVGTIYNYFPSKMDLIAATIQEVWQGIFHIAQTCKNTKSFPEYVLWIFDTIQVGVEQYPNFFTAHSISFTNTSKEKGKQVMSAYFTHIKSGMLDVLKNDSNVKLAAFSKDFTENSFVDFVFLNLIALITNQKKSCKVLIEIIKRTIY